eukprot:1114948-Prorocentrum_minimum.AAC.5
MPLPARSACPVLQLPSSWPLRCKLLYLCALWQLWRLNSVALHLFPVVEQWLKDCETAEQNDNGDNDNVFPPFPDPKPCLIKAGYSILRSVCSYPTSYRIQLCKLRLVNSPIFVSCVWYSFVWSHLTKFGNRMQQRRQQFRFHLTLVMVGDGASAQTAVLTTRRVIERALACGLSERSMWKLMKGQWHDQHNNVCNVLELACAWSSGRLLSRRGLTVGNAVCVVQTSRNLHSVRRPSRSWRAPGRLAERRVSRGQPSEVKP